MRIQKFTWPGTQEARERSAKALHVGANPTQASDNILVCRGGGMVDSRDLKSLDRKVVWVRLPLPALKNPPSLLTGNLIFRVILPEFQCMFS